MTQPIDPRFRRGDLVDITFQRALVTKVHDDGRLAVTHVDQQMHHLDPDVTEVEVTVVGTEADL